MTTSEYSGITMTMSNEFAIKALDVEKVVDIDNGVFEEARPFILARVVERDSRVPVEEFKGFISQYYQDHLKMLDPEDQINKLDGKIIQSRGYHKYVIAAWFDLLLGYSVADYDSGNPGFKKYGYQNTQDYAVLKETLREEILNNDRRFAGFKNVSAGYYKIRARELLREYTAGGKKDSELKEKARNYQYLSTSLEMTSHGDVSISR